MPNSKTKQREVKKEKCPECGQWINEDIWQKHQIKRLRDQGLPQLADALKLAYKYVAPSKTLKAKKRKNV